MAAKQLGAFFGQIAGAEDPASVSGIILREGFGEGHVRVLVLITIPAGGGAGSLGDG